MTMSSRRSAPRTCRALVRWLGPLVVAGACGGGDEGGGEGARCAESEVDEFPDGLLARPEALAPADSPCEPGSLAGVDLDGRWSVTGDGLFTLENTLIRDDCSGRMDIEIDAYPDKLIHRDDTTLFWRSWLDAEEYSIATAVRACAMAGSDELAVAIGRCTQIAGEEATCSTEQGRMKRFGRPAGEAEAEGLELVSEWSGGDEPWPASLSLNVKVAGGVAFVSRFGELRLVDVSDPARPRDLGVVDSEDGGSADFNDVKLFEAEGGTHAVLAGRTTPVVDARDPTAPVVAAHLGEYSHSVFVRTDSRGRTLAYLATYGADVPIYDVSAPGDPVLLERVPVSRDDGVHDLYAEEDRLYLNATTAGFLVLERSGVEWTELGGLPSPYSHASWVGEVGGRRIAIAGDEGRGAHLRVVDLDPVSPEFLREIGSYQTRPEVSIHNMMLLGDRAYVTYYQDGARILDLTDPTRPERAAYFHTWDLASGGPGPFDGAIGLDVDRSAGLVYVADGARGLLILRETAPGGSTAIVDRLAPSRALTGRAGRPALVRSPSTSRAAGAPGDTP